MMVVMWAVIILGLIAGCGRVGFDPLGDDGTTGESGDASDPNVDAGGSSGSGGGSDSGTMPTTHYVSGGTSSNGGMASSLTTMTGPLTGTNMVLVVAIHWRDTTSSVTTVQDSFGNGFSMAGSMARYNAQQSQVLWVKRITAGTTINVLFDQPAAGISVKWAAYRDIDQTMWFFGPRSASGTGTAVDSGAMMLPPGSVLVAAVGSRAPSASAGPGFTERQKVGGGVLEDLETGSGSLNATATLSSSNDWIIHLVALHPQ